MLTLFAHFQKGMPTLYAGHPKQFVNFFGRTTLKFFHNQEQSVCSYLYLGFLDTSIDTERGINTQKEIAQRSIARNFSGWLFE